MSWDNRRTERPNHDEIGRELRIRILERDDYTCRLRYVGCTELAEEVDHILAWFLGGGVEPENLQSVCHGCHALKTGRESALARKLNQRKALHRSARLPHPAYR